MQAEIGLAIILIIVLLADLFQKVPSPKTCNGFHAHCLLFCYSTTYSILPVEKLSEACISILP